MTTHIESTTSSPARAPVDITRFTRAPLRMQGTFHFDLSPEELWPRVTAPELIASWFPTMTGGEVDHSNSSTPGDWGEGTKRYCHARGMGTLDETILHWDPPKTYVYRVVNRMMPIRDHAAVMRLEPDPDGGSRFTWEQYFEPSNRVTIGPFKLMMTTMMNKGLRSLVHDLGGRGGKIRVVG